MRKSFILSTALFLLMTLSPGGAAEQVSAPQTDIGMAKAQPFGKTPSGEAVTLYTLTNKNGMSVSVMDYGASIVKLLVPNRTGKLDDVVLGFDQPAPYFNQKAHFGGTLGRYANRIAGGRFQLNRTSYQVTRNNGPNSIHGGTRGFDRRMWKIEPVESDVPAIRFTRLSPDGEEGFPGNLFVSVTFTLTDDNRLRIAYQATTDATTVINLSNHTYFNLSGAGSGSILEHILTLHANAYTPVDANQIPTGEIKDVTGTPLDFLSPTPIGQHLQETGVTPPGYDNNYVLQKGFFSNWGLAAEIEDPKSGRTMSVYTDQPGIQFNTASSLNGSFTGMAAGKKSKVFHPYDGFCLETQHFPDSPNHDNFPSTVLSPGQVYKTSTVYAFGVK